MRNLFIDTVYLIFTIHSNFQIVSIMINIVKNSFYIQIHVLSHDYNLIYINFETLTTHYHQHIT